MRDAVSRDAVSDDVAAVRRSIDRATAALAAAGARDEALAQYVTPSSVFGIAREPRMRQLARVWRLGVLLLGSEPDTAGRVWATGSIVRVRDPGRPQFQSRAAEVQRAYRAAAVRGGFFPGTVLNHGATPIPIDETLLDSAGPLFLADGAAMVRWNADASAEDAVPLDDYLADRVALLAAPPAGSTD